LRAECTVSWDEIYRVRARRPLRYNLGVLPPPTFLRRLARYYGLAVAFWLPASVLVAWQQYWLLRRSHLAVILHDLLIVYGVRYLTVAVLTVPIFFIVSRWPVAVGVARRLGAYILGYVPFAIAFGFIRWCIAPPWMEETLSWGPRTAYTLYELTSATFADVAALYLAVTLAAHAYSYFTRTQRQEIERLELRQSLAQSELQALKTQLQPHFLFNTLQGISTLIDTDRVTAQDMLRRLATLLRTTLKHGATDLIPFREELDFVRSYLDLEAMRLGKRLRAIWQISPDTQHAQIPQLLLQPLVENAIVHGIASAREGGWIELEARIERRLLYVRISNSVGGHSPTGLALGLQNTRARLQYLYGEDASFEFRVAADGVATATIVVPGFATMTEDDPEEIVEPQIGRTLNAGASRRR
jgi:two-component system, LytTR family, sensor kinase